jgi:sulfonate transport system ATP-binding protein
MKAASAISAESVSKRYTEADFVLRSLSLEVAPSEVVTLLGPSGSGKSTVLRLLSGLEREHEGRLLVQGVEVQGPTPSVGMMFQEPRLLPWRTVEGNVAFGLPASLPKELGKTRVEQLLELVQLTQAKDKLPKELSGGMAQRVALARCLAGAPSVLLLDEPFSAVDALTRMHLQELLLSIWTHTRLTMLLVTHDIDEALFLSDRVVVLRGSPARIEETLSVPLGRPRDRRDEALGPLRAHLLEALRLAGDGQPRAAADGPQGLIAGW